MKQNIVFISSQVKPRRLRELLAQKGSAFRIIVVDSDSLNRFSGFDAESLKPYQEQVKKENNYWHIAMEWMDDWNRKTQFYKKVMHQGFSLWWFGRFGFHHWLQETLADVDAIKEVIEETNPAQVLLVEVSDHWQDVIQGVAAQADIPLEMIEQRGISTRLSNYVSWLTRIKGALPLLTVKGLRTIQGMWRLLIISRLKGSKQSRPKVLMTMFSVSWQRLMGYGDGKPQYLDAQQGLVLRELIGENFEVVALDRMSQPKDGFRTFLQKKYPYIPLEGYSVPYLFKSFNRIRKEKQKATSTWEDIKREPNFWQGNFYRNIDISSLITNRLNSFVTKGIPAYIMRIEFCQAILNSQKPNAVMIAGEYFYPGQYLIVAAKTLGIPIIGMQHGTIHEEHIGYVYPKDVDRETIPLPDKVAVFGDYYKEILTKQSVYRESQVEVTGQSRLDFITQKSFSNVGKFSTLPELPRDKKIILFTSQPGIEQMASSLLMEGLSQLGNDYFLIIKLHLTENENLASPYYELGIRYGVRNFIIVKQVDLYELLALCDLHISVYSTVLSEAVIFGKPNLILSILGSHDIGSWVEQGVALNLNDFTCLKEAVETILGDEEVREKLRRARQAYIQRHYYKLDGKASERICTVVDKCLKAEVNSKRESRSN